MGKRHRGSERASLTAWRRIGIRAPGSLNLVTEYYSCFGGQLLTLRLHPANEQETDKTLIHMNAAPSLPHPPPRVVIIDDFVFPYRVPFFAELARQAIDLTVLFCTSRIPSRPWKQTGDLGFRHEFLLSRLLHLGGRRHPGRTIYFTPTLLFRLIKLQPDVVVAYAYSLPTIIAFVYCWLTGKSFISWADGTPHTNQTLSAGQNFVRRFIIPRAHACLTPTPAGRETFVGCGARPEKVWMIPHSAAPEIGQMADATRGRQQTAADLLGFKPPCALYVGALVPGKGIRYLLEAVARAQEQLGTKIHLLLAGEGPQKGELEALGRQLGLGDQICFLGFVQPDALPAVYAAADLFLFPSLNDTFAFVIGESVRCGLPVVASKFAGASEVLIQPGWNGFIIDPTELPLFAEAIVAILREDKKRIEMGRNSREMAERFSIQGAVDQCLEAIRTAQACSPDSLPSTATVKDEADFPARVRA